MADHRERALTQLHLLAKEGSVLRAFPKHLGGQADAGGNIAQFEEIFLADPSLQIKAGVQWGLFAAAVLHLGTERHHDELLPGAMNMDVPGAFAMTETGHGSDVASIATTATFDEHTGDFVLNTPFRAAWKDYLGNAAKDGIAAVVFAQLITKGVNHGVHAFYVPIRDAATGEFLPGIGGEDDGLKGGLNGIDNGRLHFTDVRVPRLMLLNRYGNVDEQGVYTSSIDSPGRRFFTMLGTLVQGRVSLDGSAVVASKLALTIALTYGSQRRQFAGPGNEEMVLLDYQRHQRRLLPWLATTYAMSFAHERFLDHFDGVFSGERDTPHEREDLETLAAALKPLSTWNALEILQECREACGGAGFLAENQFVMLRADMDVYATFEGDNNVLLQLVAKRLLTDYSRKFANVDAGALAQYVVGQVGEAAVNRSGLRQFVQNVKDFGPGRAARWATCATPTRSASCSPTACRPWSPSSRASSRTHTAFPKRRAPRSSTRTRTNSSRPRRRTASCCSGRRSPTPSTRSPTRARSGCSRGCATCSGSDSSRRTSPGTSSTDGSRRSARWRSPSTSTTGCCRASASHALDLVAAFEFTPELIAAPIALGGEQQRQDDARAWFAERRAAGTLPVEEKVLKDREKRAKR